MWELVCWAEEGVGIPCPVPLIRVEVSRLRYTRGLQFQHIPLAGGGLALGAACPGQWEWGVCLCVCACACARSLSALKALCPEPGAKRGRVFGAPWEPLPSWGLSCLSLPALDPDPDVRAGSAAEGRKGSLVPRSFMPPKCQGREPCVLVSSCWQNFRGPG